MPAADPLAALDAVPDALVAAAIVRLAGRAMQATAGPVDAPDALLDVGEAAALLRKPRRWVWANARPLGATRVSARRLLFSRRRLVRWLEARRPA